MVFVTEKKDSVLCLALIESCFLTGSMCVMDGHGKKVLKGDS